MGTKGSSLLDFTYLSLEELESQIVLLFPNDEYEPKCLFHMYLLGSLSFGMICDGWTKEELLEFFTERVDESIDLLAELKKEERVA